MKPTLSNQNYSRKATKYRGTKCLNCEQPLDKSDIYCPYCSQLNSTKQLSLKDFIAEFINSLVVFDSRLRNTLKDLVFRPGVITTNYVKGQRLKYANPFRFFLSVSIIYFLLNGFINKFIISENPFKPTDSSQNDSNKKTTDTEVQENIFSNDVVKIYNNDSSEIKKDSIPNAEDSVTSKPIKYITQKELDTMGWAQRNYEKIDTYVTFFEKTKIEDPTIALDSLNITNTKYNRWLYSKNKTVSDIGKNPTDFINYLAAKTPFFLFFFTPIFAVFFWYIYSRKKYTYIEHVVFIFHIFSFLFLIMLIILIPQTILGTEILTGILFGLVGPFYFYKALRNFYKQSRFITILKFVFLNIVFFISSTIVAILFFAATAIVY